MKSLSDPQFQAVETVIIYGSDKYDWRAYKADIFAIKEAYETLWVRGGINEWRDCAQLGGKADSIVTASRNASKPSAEIVNKN